ncbi:hypothetical protein [Streptomyces sp. NPDC088725]|uniref:hypothetical protein n=1 Tax=Streptomyces sp. NPDC088725 TaxID=3365873 RepID=UPI0037FE98B5
MRTLRRRAAALLATALITTSLAATWEVRSTTPASASGRAVGDDNSDHTDRRFLASCRVKIKRSHATAFCHNPYPVTDRVALHIECARWWDVDADTAPVEVPPAGYVELTDRCWMEIHSAWVGHDPLRPVRPGN